MCSNHPDILSFATVLVVNSTKNDKRTYKSGIVDMQAGSRNCKNIIYARNFFKQSKGL